MYSKSGSELYREVFIFNIKINQVVELYKLVIKRET